MTPDPVRVEDTKAWLLRALDDLNVAEHDLGASPPFVRAALFHCQQVVEKSLKGFLEWHDRPFDRTHELEKLGHLCVTVDPTLENLLAPTGWLTAYAARFRYPGAPYEPTIDDAQEGRGCRRKFTHKA